MSNWLDSKLLLILGGGTILALAVLAISFYSPAAKAKKGKGKSWSGGSITGTLSNKGVECQGMLGDDRNFYTLINVDRTKMVAGTRVRVTGKPRRITKCMQGQTIAIDSITYLK